jgi:hypothetical protein
MLMARGDRQCCRWLEVGCGENAGEADTEMFEDMGLVRDVGMFILYGLGVGSC